MKALALGTLHQAANEMDVAGKPIQLRDDKLCLVLPASHQGLFELGTRMY
jgi:hypothetical protein